MNTEEARKLGIQRWRATLDNHDLRMQVPEVHRAHLHEISSELAAKKLIDRMEQFEMDEIANAAYWHAIEELQSHPVIYRSSYGYDVVPEEGGPRIGTIFHSVLSLDESYGDSLRPYDGKVYRDETGLILKYSFSTCSGRIEGLTLTMNDGQRYELIETKRMVSGKTYWAIEDPDVYRWMIDVVELATENHDIEIVQRIRPFLELARFIRCSFCLDRFGEREDCAPCNGLGFVEKPRHASKLPEKCQGQLNNTNGPGERDVRRC
ncbi:hypothetical protein [Pseudomonas mediterranea]|uniref:hypothetical protein n=1 Tax=Pseudomonas mediterranea TaxID=183795 RepID=UPI0022348798|nr:hypothetical protein [Pseudomonas mediterranea]UZE02173.1 hypothetical protein LOY71_05945 [Pseudomonas mediterranea]